MDDKTLQALTILATKLGTTAEYLWSVLLKQAPITGLVDLLVVAAWVAGCVMWFKFVSNKTKVPPKTEEEHYPSAEWSSSEGTVLAWISVGALFLATAICVGGSMSSIVAAIVNPEYWALRQILK